MQMWYCLLWLNWKCIREQMQYWLLRVSAAQRKPCMPHCQIPHCIENTRLHHNQMFNIKVQLRPCMPHCQMLHCNRVQLQWSSTMKWNFKEQSKFSSNHVFQIQWRSQWQFQFKFECSKAKMLHCTQVMCTRVWIPGGISSMKRENPQMTKLGLVLRWHNISLGNTLTKSHPGKKQVCKWA